MTKKQRIEKLEQEVVELKREIVGLQLELVNKQNHHYPGYIDYRLKPVEPYYTWTTTGSGSGYHTVYL